MNREEAHSQSQESLQLWEALLVHESVFSADHGFLFKISSFSYEDGDHGIQIPLPLGGLWLDSGALLYLGTSIVQVVGQG